MIKNRGVPLDPLVPPTCTPIGEECIVCVPLPNPYNRNKLILSFLNIKTIHAYTIHSTPLYTIGGGTCGTCGTLVFERFRKFLEPSTFNALFFSFFLQTFSPMIEVVR